MSTEAERLAEINKKNKSSSTEKAPVNKGDYTDFGINMWKGDQLESTDLATGKKSKDWNVAKIRTNNEELNKLATKLGFDPNKWEGKDVNEKFQRFLDSNPLPGADFKSLIDTEHSTDAGGHGLPQTSGKRYDGKLGTRWLDAISKIKLPEDAPTAVIPEEKAKDIIPNRGQQYSNDAAYAPFWLQDVINTASAAGNRWGLKKYLPWAPQVQLQTPRPTFYDPTRELANNTEQMAIGTEGAGIFAGPQAFNSRFAQIQGEGAKNAANILANYHNKNVGIANQFENIRTDIYNKNNMLNAGVAQKLYDGTTIANQQFDNAKRQANGEIRDAYTNALTNRAKTQTLNSIYPNFKIDPTQGGTLGFYDGTDIQPGNASTPESVLAAIQKAKGIYTGLDEDTIAKVYGYGDGKSGTRRDQDALNILNNFPQRKGGEVDDDYVEDYRRMKSIFE